MTTESEWIDISVPLRTDMAHWPGDPPVRIERVSDMELDLESRQMPLHHHRSSVSDINRRLAGCSTRTDHQAKPQSYPITDPPKPRTGPAQSPADKNQAWNHFFHFFT